MGEVSQDLEDKRFNIMTVGLVLRVRDQLVGNVGYNDSQSVSVSPSLHLFISPDDKELFSLSIVLPGRAGQDWPE